MNLLDYLSLPYTHKDKDLVLECLWCSHPKLYVSPDEDYKLQCFHCKQKGNAYSIIRQFYDNLPEPRLSDLLPIRSEKPGIILRALTSTGIRLYAGHFILPVYNISGDIVSLHKCSESPIGPVINSPKPTSESILGLERFDTQIPLIWIAEGWWDYLALLPLVSDLELNLIATTGSSYPKKHLALLDQKNIITLYDNDEAGRAGTLRLHRDLKQSPYNPSSIAKLVWPSDYPDKYDIRDFINDNTS